MRQLKQAVGALAHSVMVLLLFFDLGLLYLCSWLCSYGWLGVLLALLPAALVVFQIYCIRGLILHFLWRWVLRIAFDDVDY